MKVYKIRKLILTLLWKFKRIPTSNVFEEMYAREHFSKMEWDSYQNEQLHSLILHCYKNVPYYKELFDSLQIKPNDIQSKEDLVKIPILTKEIVRKNVDKLIATNIPKSSIKHANTSGSTGTPLKIFYGKNRTAYLTASIWRILSRSGWKPVEQVVYIWGFDAKSGIVNKLINKFREFVSGSIYLSAWNANEADFKLWFNEITKSNAKVIVCYASAGSRFAQWMLDNNLTIEGIKGVYCSSEKLYDAQKEVIEKAFNTLVYNFYGCREINGVACTCKNNVMHIYPDVAIVEEGEPNSNGDKPLILTGLRNLTMPLIRYENGDCGSIDNSVCDCGMGTDSISLDVARLSDVFTFKSGKKFPSLYFILRIYKDGFDGVELFQFHQTKFDLINFYIVKNSKFNNDTELSISRAVEEIYQMINGEASIKVLYTDYIEQSSSSKHYYAKSDIKN